MRNIFEPTGFEGLKNPISRFDLGIGNRNAIYIYTYIWFSSQDCILSVLQGNPVTNHWGHCDLLPGNYLVLNETIHF